MKEIGDTYVLNSLKTFIKRSCLFIIYRCSSMNKLFSFIENICCCKIKPNHFLIDMIIFNAGFYFEVFDHVNVCSRLKVGLSE